MRFGRRSDNPALGSDTARPRESRPAPGRHRGTGEEQRGADLAPDEELESYLDAISPLRDPEVTDPGRRFGSARVYQLRLPAGAEEKVEWLAAQRDTATLAMLQEWVLDRLSEEFGPQRDQR